MQFSDVIDQYQTKQHLTDMLQQNRLSHALLFSGKEGFGGLPLALAFAQFVVCENKLRATSDELRDASHNAQAASSDQHLSTVNYQPSSDSCGVCPACLK